jgi:hypothetical protein
VYAALSLSEMRQQLNEIHRMQQLAGIIKENNDVDVLNEKETDDEKIERFKKYTYTLNGKIVTPEIDFYNNILKAELDGEIYRIGIPVGDTVELSPIKGKTGSYT